jgi:hypothetical protein
MLSNRKIASKIMDEVESLTPTSTTGISDKNRQTVIDELCVLSIEITRCYCSIRAKRKVG